MQNNNSLPPTGYLRLTQIIGNKKTGERGLIPVSRSTWWAGVKSGRYPEPSRKLGKRITAWSVESIKTLIESAMTNEVQQ
jgi:prophage regulatory protein